MLGEVVRGAQVLYGFSSNSGLGAAQPSGVVDIEVTRDHNIVTEVPDSEQGLLKILNKTDI